MFSDKEYMKREPNYIQEKERLNRETPNPEKPKKAGSAVWEWVKVIVIAVAIALIINFFVIVNSVVPTGSMENTIMAGTRMLGFRLTYLFEQPKRGDIIIFKYPDNPSENYVKRIIGLPGETVEIIGGVTYVDGTEIDEPYLKETPWEENWGPYEVPEDSYFVMGDNRNNSKDSRYWTTTNYVPKENILGKALLIYYPFSDFGSIK